MLTYHRRGIEFTWRGWPEIGSGLNMRNFQDGRDALNERSQRRRLRPKQRRDAHPNLVTSWRGVGERENEISAIVNIFEVVDVRLGDRQTRFSLIQGRKAQDTRYKLERYFHTR